MKKLSLIALLALAPLWSHADQVAVAKFGLLNNNNNSVTISPSQAQDLLNVDVTPGGLSVKKRFGYGIYKTTDTLQAMHGGYHFFNSSGNDVQIWGSSTTLFGITSDATPVRLISSATLNSTWDCADSQSSAYCVNSNRNAYVKTDGATMTWYASPLGTMVESTPDRMVVAGVSGTPNTLYVSQSNVFTNFTTGVNSTDAFTEVIASPGSKITHIRWGCGKLLWWKDASFGYFDFDDQYAAQVKTVSDVIGTFDNTSAIDPSGRVWFRGQDGHTWMYDCSFLTKESVDITPNVQASGKRVTNAWTQTTQSDWQSGSGIPAANFSTTISAGDVVLSSYTATDIATISSPTYNSAQISNNSFESGQTTNWTVTGSGFFSNVGATAGTCGTVSPTDGSLMEQVGTGLPTAQVINAATSALIASTALTTSAECTWTVNDIVIPAASIGVTAKVRFFIDASDYLTSDAFVLNGNNVKVSANKNHTSGPTINRFFFDFVSNSPSATQGAMTSAVFDSGITKTTVQLQSSWNTGSAPTMSLETAASSAGSYSAILTSTGTNAAGLRYFRYVATFTVSGVDAIASNLATQTLVAVSSGGVFLSAVHNAPSFTSWSTIGVNSQSNGGTHSFFTRAGGTLFSITSSTPGWIAQTNGSLITASTGVYVQFRDDFTSSSSTAAFALNDFTLNWFEGSSSDQAYMLYFDNAIWESVAFGVGQSTNNYIFKYDLINDGWTVYNFGAGGMLVQSNNLYFGDTSLGNIFNFGTVRSDNGTAIQSYWKSKDFAGPDPYLQSQLTNIDTFTKKDQGSTLTATYTTDTSTATAYSINLSTSSNIVQNRKLLPSGKLGYTFNVKYGDTSATSQWELFGFRIGYVPLNYRPTQ